MSDSSSVPDERAPSIEADAPRHPDDDGTQVDVRGESVALPSAELDAVEPGTKIGRYTILEIIGAGGVGIVYSAYDPDLDRKVALKQLRRSKLLGQTDAVSNRRIRLVREAQALARLSHPNVVPVYEVATFDGQIYVVMEFVAGSTLNEWLAATPRSWSEIIALFVQAARGLAAAHAADIVHRDFKPENVRVGIDGRVRVLDFGLAAQLREQEPPSSSGSDLIVAEDHSWSDASISNNSGERQAVTREGQVMGTPAYMAPEQARGAQVDARSDQFSFCVALYEALYGKRPFRGSYNDLRRFRDLSRAKTLPGNRPEGMPQEIERVLLRGLSLQPEKRFASMDELIVALGSVARGWRRLLVVPIATLLLALLTVVAFYEQREGVGGGCDDGRKMLEGVWDKSIANELEQAALNSGQPYARETWATVERNLDEWTSQWSHARLRACESAGNDGTRSNLLARRVACLDLQLARVEGMIIALRHQPSSPEALLEHLSAISLPSLDGCASTGVLERDDLLPRDEASAKQVVAIRESLAVIDGLLTIGEFEQATTQAEVQLAQAQALDFDAIEAEAQLRLGLALSFDQNEPERTRAALRSAGWAAERSGDEIVIVRAAGELAELSGRDSADLELAEIWAELARAAFTRHGSDAGVELELRRHLGKLASTAGDYETALIELRRALELADETESEQTLAYIETLSSVGDAQRELGRFDEAKQTLTRARQLATTSFGQKHPIVAEVLDGLANVESARGQFVTALELHRAALALNEEVFGPHHRKVAKNLNNLAILYDETGRYTEAIDTLTRAREILVEHLGPEHPEVAFVDINLGAALQSLGRYDESLQRNELALQNLERSFGPTHMTVGVALQNIGASRTKLGDQVGALAALDRSYVVLHDAFGDEHPSIASLEVVRAQALRGLGRLDESVAAAKRALGMREHIFGADHQELVTALTELGKSELALGQITHAREHAERGLELSGDGNTPTERAAVRLLLARVLEKSRDPSDLAHARALGLEALAILRTSESHTELRGQLDDWLAAQGIAG